MKVVLYVIDTLEVGGAERSTLEIASRLTQWTPVICQLYKGSTLLADYRFAPQHLVNFELDGPYQFRTAFKKMMALLKKVKPDLVVATLLRSELVTRYCCKRLGIPVVGTFVNDTYSPLELQQVSTNLRLKIRFFQVLNALTARWCISFISNANAIKHSNAKALRLPLDKIVVIPRGRLVPANMPALHSRNNGITTIVNVGRLIRRKGQLELLTAFKKLNARFPDTRLIIAGEGPFRKELEAFIHQENLSGKVDLRGTVRQIEELYRQSDLAVFASHYEGFSGALLEAVLAGVPVVASDIEMNREVIPENAALFYPVMDSEALYKCLLHAVINSEENALRAKNAFMHAANHFDINAIAKRHEAHYNLLISKAAVV
jgi:glycosyltransferase involved in cell wall biosynthesis